MSDQIPVFGIEDGVGQSGGTWYADALSTTADSLGSSGPVTALGDDALSYRWINTSATSKIKNRVVRTVSNVAKSTIAAILNHNLSERAMSRLIVGKAVERPAFRMAASGDRAVSAASIAAPTGDYTIDIRWRLRHNPGLASAPISAFEFQDGGGAAANHLIRISRLTLDGRVDVVPYHYTAYQSGAIAAASIRYGVVQDWVIRFRTSDKLFEVFIDGVLALSITATNNTSAHASNRLGFGLTGNFNRQDVLACEMWSRRWTDAEVAAWKAEARSGSEANLIAAYRFSEGSGSTVADSGPGGYTLTLTGGSWISAVDDRRVAQDGYDSGDVQVWHDPPRVATAKLPSGGRSDTPATLTYPRSCTLDVVLMADPLVSGGASFVVIASLFKTGPTTDALVTLALETNGNLTARSWRGGTIIKTLLSAADLRNNASGRHLRIVVDGESAVLRGWVDGAEIGSGSALGAYSSDVTGAAFRIGHTTGFSGVEVLHATLREGVFTDAADLAAGWRPRPWWSRGLIAQIQVVNGAVVDTGPSALTVTNTGQTYGEVGNPNPNAVFLDAANTGNIPSGSISDRYRPIIPFYMGSTEIEWNQAVMEIFDPHNSDSAVMIGRLFIPASFKPTYGREPDQGMTIESPAIARTRLGAPMFSTRGSWSNKEVKIVALTEAEYEELFARLGRYRVNKAPILVLERSDVAQHRLAHYCIFGVPVSWSSADFGLGLSLRKCSVMISGVEA